MPLSPGTRLGPYEITAQIGVGGMGEVYRATDATLDRQVAIKVLPEAFAADPERLARFEREAKTLAAMNHPNIAQIHGFEKSGGVHALVMELVEGSTLADRIAQGAIPVDEALPIAKQIAEALEAAHEQVIIHRDLKPANVKVRPDGTVKVLDFGLAKAMEPVGAMSPGTSQSPTITTPAMTQAGMILGTAAYMSPEQARGKPVDRRTDVWAFGCVLYEMLTGGRAFPGEDVSDVFAAIIKSEPDWTLLPGGLSSVVQRFLRRCLEKDIKQRVPDIVVMRQALQGAYDVSEPNVEPPQSGTPLIRVAVLVLTALAVGVLAGWSVSNRLGFDSDAALTEFAFELPTDEGIGNYTSRVVALSPDGRAVAFYTSRGLYIRNMSDADPRFLPGTEGGRGPFFSRDGQSVVYIRGTGDSAQILRIGVQGGAPVALVDGSKVLGAGWGRESSLLVAEERGILEARLDDGAQEIVVSAGPDETFADPQLLPDQDSILFTVATGSEVTRWEEADVVVHRLSTGERTVVVEGGVRAQYVSTGHLIYSFGSDLFGVGFNPATLTISGNPVPLVDGLQQRGNPSNSIRAASFDVSSDGSLVYVPETTSDSNRPLVWVDRLGREEEVLPIEPDRYNYPRISPDGRQAAIWTGGPGVPIWMWDFASATRTRMAIGPLGGAWPYWTRDGERILYTNPDGFHLMAANNTGSPQLVWQNSENQTATLSDFMTPSETEIVFSVPRGQNRDIGIVSMAEGAEPTYLLTGIADQRAASLSPSGRWMSYQSDESGRVELYVTPFPDVQSDRIQVSNAGGTSAVWSRDERELFYLEPGEAFPRLMQLSIDTGGDELIVRDRTVLFDWPYNTTNGMSFDVSLDGERFLVVASPGGQRESIIVVQNFVSELERLVPTDN